MANAYPSPGRILPRGVYTGLNGQPEPVWVTGRQAQPIITNGQFSMPEPIDDAIQWRLRIKFATAPTTATTIQFASDPTFADVITFPRAVLIPLRFSAQRKMWHITELCVSLIQAMPR